MAKIVMESAIEIHPDAQIQGQVAGCTPVVLGKHPENVGAVLVIEYAAAAKTAHALPDEEILPIVESIGCGSQEDLAVESLGKFLVEINAGEFAAEPEIVGAVHPAHIVDKVEIVLGLKLIRGRGRAYLETGSAEREFVDGLRDVVRCPDDPQVRGRNRVAVVQAVVQPDITESEIVHYRRLEPIGFPP